MEYGVCHTKLTYHHSGTGFTQRNYGLLTTWLHSRTSNVQYPSQSLPLTRMSAATTTMEELARLRNALGASDKQTQRFLQPLLPLRGVQELLLTFVRDTSRSFEDWVWDPQVRQTLLRMRDAEPQMHAQGESLTSGTRAVEEKMSAMALQNPDDDTPPEFLQEADAAQSDGKQKFKEKNYYAARNAFQKEY